VDYGRIYEYRFRNVDQGARERVWERIAPHVHAMMGAPQRVLDPAAGRGEFIKAVPAAERWAVDEVAYPEAAHGEGTTVITAKILDAELPAGYFDGIWVSNFLEHLPGQEGVAEFLERMHDVASPGGRIAIMGPNYRYAAREYWDFADHIVPLTHNAVCEHLYGAGFEPVSVNPRFLPYSFNGILPPSPRLTGLYLRFPPAWRLLGKQFLIIGRR
jgi:SAM-dependent methyltransferase